MLFQMRFRTLFTLLLSLIAPAGFASADMRFNFENCYKWVGAAIGRPRSFVLQENCPGKCVAAPSRRAANGRPYTRNKARMQFFDGLTPRRQIFPP